MLIKFPEGMQYTPLLIGVCSDDGAMLCADSRTTCHTEDGFETDDTCKKLFRVNDRLILAVSGLFRASDRFIEPLVGQNCASLNTDSARDLIEEYLLGEIAVGNPVGERCYVLAGADADGMVCLETVSYNGEDGMIETDKQLGDEKGCYILMLPPNGWFDAKGWHERLEDVLEDNGTPLPERLRGFVAELEKISDMVGGRVKCELVKFST